MTTGFVTTRRRWAGWLMALLPIPLIVIAIAAMQTQSAAAPVIIAPTSTLTITPRPTPTPTATSTITPTPTITPAPTTARPTATPTPTMTPMPTIIVTPLPLLPPAADGVKRSATLPIVMYHYISAPPSLNDRIRVRLSVAPDTFDAQMKLLADNGFHAISLFDLYEHLANGKDLPDRPVIVTFDDGYLDNYQNAFPILKKYGLTATFFVLTGRSDSNDPAYMTWDMIKEMSDAGMDIQLHAKEHVDLRRRDYDYLFFQIYGGRQSIEGHTGRPVVFIAYPSGKYDDAVLRFLTTHRFWAALTTHPGRTFTLKDALTWPRVRISGQLSLDGFAKAIGIQ